MDYSMDAVANKMILVIVGLSAVMSVFGFVIYMVISGNPESSPVMGMLLGINNVPDVRTADAVPFAIGVSMVMCLNVAKVLLMKRAVNNAVKRDSVAAKLYLQGQYFSRLVLTAGVLFLAGWLHTMVNEAGNPQYVNFMGAFFGIFTFPVATYSMRFFLRDELNDNKLPESTEQIKKSVTQSAIDELNAIGAASEETQPETNAAEATESE
jgi:hypothetical protein